MRVRLLLVIVVLMFGGALLASCGDDAAIPAPTPPPTMVPRTRPPATEDEAGQDSSTDADADAEPTPTPEPSPTPEPAPTARLPVDVVEATGGDGITQPLATAVLPEGWTETEYLVGGEAVGYAALDELGEDGVWDSTENGAATYQTRMIVRTPAAEDFSGVVFVEWFNVTAGTDTSPTGAYVSQELARSGHAYVGVSAQAVGVNGAEGGRLAEGLVDTRGLVVRDPERYGTLVHPGDAFAFDIFTQGGATVAASGSDGVDVLGGLTPTHVIAAGESQSASFLTTYVNAVHPLAGLYDGFFIHSRGDGAPSPAADRETTEGIAVRTRTDLSEPVFIFQAETDINLLEYALARQDDTDAIVTWRVAAGRRTLTPGVSASAPVWRPTHRSGPSSAARTRSTMDPTTRPSKLPFATSPHGWSTGHRRRHRLVSRSTASTVAPTPSSPSCATTWASPSAASGPRRSTHRSGCCRATRAARTRASASSSVRPCPSNPTCSSSATGTWPATRPSCAPAPTLRSRPVG